MQDTRLGPLVSEEILGAGLSADTRGMAWCSEPKVYNGRCRVDQSVEKDVESTVKLGGHGDYWGSIKRSVTRRSQERSYLRSSRRLDAQPHQRAVRPHLFQNVCGEGVPSCEKRARQRLQKHMPKVTTPNDIGNAQNMISNSKHPTLPQTTWSQMSCRDDDVT